jgi:hypothetical protein
MLGANREETCDKAILVVGKRVNGGVIRLHLIVKSSPSAPCNQLWMIDSKEHHAITITTELLTKAALLSIYIATARRPLSSSSSSANTTAQRNAILYQAEMG